MGAEKRLKTRGCEPLQALHEDHGAPCNSRPTYLHCHYRQDLHGDAIKLIEAAPGSGLSKAFVDVATGL